MIDQDKEKVVPVVMAHDKYDLYDELRENKFGSCSTGAMYRILLDRGYESITNDHMRLRSVV
jgi:hypothetical protein